MRVQRGIAIDGGDAAAWLGEFDLETRSGSGTLRVRADALHAPDFSLARVWHSSAALRPRTNSGPADRAWLFVPVYGSASTLRPGEAPRPFAAPQVLMCRPGDELEVLNVEPFAWIILRSAASRLLPDRTGGYRTSSLFDADLSLREVFVSAASSALNLDLRVSSPQFASWRRGMEHLAQSLFNSPAVDLPTAAMTRDLYSLALSCIELRASDPEFRTSHIARELGVSAGHLYRVFSGHGTTPGAELAHRRLQLALDLLSDHPSTHEYAEVAARSGFPSGRALRAVIQPGHTPSQLAVPASNTRRPVD